MIAQILAARRSGGPIPSGQAEGGESRSLTLGVHGVQIAVAIVLIPALVVVTAVGLVGAGAVGALALIGRAARSGR